MKYGIIHVSDIHYKSNEPEGVSAVLNSFIDDLKTQIEKNNEFNYYIAFSGDIVFAGEKQKDYDNFLVEIDNKLDAIGLPKSRRILVPGNHDIDRESFHNNIKEYKGSFDEAILSEQRFNDFIDYNNSNDTKFDNYLLFESDFAQYGLDYSNTGKGWNITDDLAVYCLNSAISSLAGIDNICDKERLAVYTRGLFEWCSKNNTNTKFLIMHHPISYLTDWSNQELNNLIEDNFLFCLLGHNHSKELFFNRISIKSIVCISPQLYSKKIDRLGYSIVFLEDNCIEKIVYRQYISGKFIKGSIFTKNSEGIEEVHNDYRKNLNYLKQLLSDALILFKSQASIFIKPFISDKREFNEEGNLIDSLLDNPYPSFIIAHPQFGLTCLSRYLRLEAYKSNKFWLYIDAKYSKARNVENVIREQLLQFSENKDSISCIIIDSWDCANIDHINILKKIDTDFNKTPILVMSNYTDYNYNSVFDKSNFKTQFKVLHLQAFKRNKVRELVSKYNSIKVIGSEDELVSKVTNEITALNIHRTPLNILTLLKVFEKNQSADIINRTKLIQTVLQILFTDTDTFLYSSNKPSVEDCEYVFGRLCKEMMIENVRLFPYLKLKSILEDYCREEYVDVNIELLINILESNNILIRFGDMLEFKHSYWIFYFAANYMLHDDEFRSLILSNNKYVNYPEIIEFYTGIDGRRTDAIDILLRDITGLISTVKEKIGISESFNPLEGVVWNPSDELIETIRHDISEKVKTSNLPTEIKDKHADKNYNSEAPYDQSIHQFLNDYSVISLKQSIKAASKALRNSNYVSPDLRIQMTEAIFNGWEQMSKVIFWLSPVLAEQGQAIYEGFGLELGSGFDGDRKEKLKKIYLNNPANVITYLKDDLSSKKIGPLIYKVFNSTKSQLQKHFISLYLIKERPIGWKSKLFDHMNLLHRNSFYLSDIKNAITYEIDHGFAQEVSKNNMRNLLGIVIAKHKTAPKKSIKKLDRIPSNLILNEKNKIPIDVILALSRKG